MSEDRRLVAIMFSDIVGYTAIMSKDVESGLALLRKNREIQKPFIEKYNGKFLKEMGDGILAQFSSAIDSVLCALEIQKMAGAELGAKLRIGIHSGDVTIENEDVFGDGVNIASRLQSIADPGGIYISESIYETIRARKDIHCEMLGDIQLKNVDHLVKTYYINEQGLPVPSTRKKHELTGLPQKPLLKQGWFYGIVLIVVIGVIVTAVWISSTRNRDIRSMAVLPVENLSGNTDEAWLETGIHNGLIDEMVKIRELRVVPRRSTLKYAGTDMTIPEIANELEVDGIVETAFSRSGNNLNLQVRLIQAHPEERQRWNASYDRMIQNILTTYCDVAKAIAGEINISLSADEESRLSSTRSVDPDAYEAYWRGMFYLIKQSQSDLNAAMQYFETAVEIDPEYALAYLGIASFWIGEMQGGFVPFSEAAPKMEEAMDKALSLDSTSMEIHYWLSVINFYYLWGWDIAEREFLKTLELNPNYAWALAHYSHFMAVMGKPAEALPYAEKAAKLEKLDLTIHGFYGMALRYVYKPDETIKILEEDLAKFPGEMMTYSTLRSAYHDKHMYDEAIHAGIKYYEIRGDTACISALEQGYRDGGYPLAMQRNAEILIEQSKTKYIPPWQVATLYTRAGMNEEALSWLEKALEEHDPNMPYINADPIFDDLREDPRFMEILRKMKLPE